MQYYLHFCYLDQSNSKNGTVYIPANLQNKQFRTFSKNVEKSVDICEVNSSQSTFPLRSRQTFLLKVALKIVVKFELQ